MAGLSGKPRLCALVGNVKRARSLVNVRRVEWGLQRRQIREGSFWLHNVGTFGVALVACRSAPLSSRLCRAALYSKGRERLHQLLRAEDVLWAAAHERMHENLVFAMVCPPVSGAPWV